jgi:TRAP transporter TAXI family solute receptor
VNLPARPLRIATGNTGGVYVAYGEGFAAAVRERLPMLQVQVVQTQGAVENLRMVADGVADVAFSLADASADALIGSESFLAPLRLAALARLYDNYAHVVVQKDSSSQRISDLAGELVSTGPERSGTSVLAGRILEAAGLRRGRDVRTVSLGLEEAAEELAYGRIAALFWSGGLPTAAILRLVRTTAVRLLDLTDVAATLTRNEVYARTTVPASAYGFEPIMTVSVSNHLVVRTEEDGELAYQLTRLLFNERARIEKEHQEAHRLNVRSAIATYPLDLHPGAQRYYREAKD